MVTEYNKYLLNKRRLEEAEKSASSAVKEAQKKEPNADEVKTAETATPAPRKQNRKRLTLRS